MPPLEQQQQHEQQQQQQQQQLQQQILAGSNPVISLLDTLQSSSSLIVGSFGSLRREAILAHSPHPVKDVAPLAHHFCSRGQNELQEAVAVPPATSFSSSSEDSPSSWWTWPGSIASAKSSKAGMKKYKITIEQVQEEDEVTKKDDRKDLATSMFSTTVMGPPGLLDWILFSTGSSSITAPAPVVPVVMESTDKQPVITHNNSLRETPLPASTTATTAVLETTHTLHNVATSLQEQGQGQETQTDPNVAQAQMSAAVTTTAATAAGTSPLPKQDTPRDLSSLPWWERRQIEVQMERQQGSKARNTTAATTTDDPKAVCPLSTPSATPASSISHQPHEPAATAPSAPPSAPSPASPPISSRPFHETTTTLTRRDGSMEIRTVRFLDPNASTHPTSSAWPTTFVSETRFRELTAEGVLVRESVTRKDVQGRDRVVWERKWGRHHRTIPLEHRAAAEAAESDSTTTTTAASSPVPLSTPITVSVGGGGGGGGGETTAMPLKQQHSQESSPDQPMDQIRHHLTWPERRRALKEQREQHFQQQQQQQQQTPTWPQEQVPSDENQRWREWRERAFHRQQKQQQQQQQQQEQQRQYGDDRRQREELEAEDTRQESRTSRWHRRYHERQQQQQQQQQQQHDELQRSRDEALSPSSEPFDRRRSWPPKAYLRRQQQQEEEEPTPRHNV